MQAGLVFLGGLGLIFTGMKLLTASVHDMVGRKLRLQLARVTQSYPIACSLGLLFGGLSQSIMLVFFTISGLIQSNSISLKRGADVLSWAYIGLSVMIVVLTAKIDTEMVIMLALGVSGIFHYFDFHKSDRFRHGTILLLAVALLMLGIDLLTRSATLMQDVPVLREVIGLAAYHPLVALTVGGIIGVILPSYLSITAIVVSLANAGILDLLTVSFVLAGAVAGSVFTWPLYVARLDGGTQTLAYFDWVNRLSGAVVVGGLAFVEWFGAATPISSLTNALAPGTIGERGALVMVLLQTIPLLQAVLFRDMGLRMAARFVRPAAIHGLAVPQYLPADDWTDAETALDLAREELLRLPRHGIAMVETIQKDPDSRPPHAAAVYAAANRTLAERIDGFIQDTLDRSKSRGLLVKGGRLAQQTQLALDMTSSISDFVAVVNRASGHRSLAGITENLIESLHMLTSTVAEALASQDADDIDLARAVTADKSKTMSDLAERVATAMASPSHEQHQIIFELTRQFDRAVWTLHRMVLEEAGNE